LIHCEYFTTYRQKLQDERMDEGLGEFDQFRLSLPAEDRNDLYRILNKMPRKNRIEKQSRKVLKIKNQSK
jgi:hypothetical protein